MAIKKDNASDSNLEFLVKTNFVPLFTQVPTTDTVEELYVSSDIPDPPLNAGTYQLRAVVGSSGDAPVYSWV